MNFSWRSTGTHTTAATAGAVLAAAVVLITPLEGTRTKTYKDSVGVDTVCVGETAKWATEEGKRRAFTMTECADMLAKSLPKYYEPMLKCMGRTDVPKSVQVAMLSATYNIGTGGFCGSSMARRIKAGDFRGACQALMGWDVAGKNRDGTPRHLPGLTKRRAIERDTCLKDL